MPDSKPTYPEVKPQPLIYPLPEGEVMPDRSPPAPGTEQPRTAVFDKPILDLPPPKPGIGVNK
jgi:hypothetical protein